ncbi:Hypothetical predicted protein [Mytilus galloprovincialis]|nr:Hypothetical predicted protein [Mytilus galloprovincialis]
MDFTKNCRLMGQPYMYKHATNLIKTLNKQREERPDLCDVTIIIEGKELKAHWCVLMTCPYFESMYNSGLAEKTSGKVTINIGKTYAVENVLQYLYLGNIEMSMSNLEDILEVADYLQCFDLKKLCNEFLDSQPMDSKSCVKICLISSLYDLAIHDEAMRFMKGHLKQVFQDEDILTLTHESVLSLLSDETLSYVSQDSFLQFLLRWLKFDIDNRRKDAFQLFLALNFENVSNESLNQVLTDNELDGLLPTNDINAILEHRNNGTNHQLQTSDIVILGGGVFFDKLNFGQPKEVILSSSSKKMYAFNLDEQKWTNLWTMPLPLERPVIRVSDDKKIHVMNLLGPARSEFSCFNRYDMHIFEIASKSWKTIKIDQDRHLIGFYLHDFILCGKRIFLLGRGVKQFNTTEESCKLIEVKDGGSIETQVLFDCNAKDHFYCSNLDSERIVIVCEWFHKKTFSIKYYNLDTHALTEPTRAKSCSSTISFTKILMYKGDIIQLDLKRRMMRKFSPNNNTWFCYPKITTPPIELSKSSMYTFCNDNLYVFGGDKSKSSYKYICKKKIWVELDDIPVTTGLYNSGVCVSTVASELVACHPNCPHCFYNSKDSGVTYPESEHSDVSYHDSDDDSDEYDWDNDYDEEEEEYSRSSDCVLM